MDDVPLIDVTGAMILKKFLRSAAAKGTSTILSGMKPGPARVLKAMQVDTLQAATFEVALEMARESAAPQRDA